MGYGNPNDLAKIHGNERGKDEGNGPRKPKELNEPRKPKTWNRLAQRECCPVKPKRRKNVRNGLAGASTRKPRGNNKVKG